MNARLRHHVTGAIERGEAEPIVEQPTPSLLAERMIAQFRLSLIQRHIFCPVTGTVLDIRTARFVLDSDGDPHLPLSPEAAAKIEASLAAGEPALREGYTLEAAK